MLGLCLGNARLASSSGLGYDVGWPELGPRVWSMPLLSLTSHDLWDGAQYMSAGMLAMSHDWHIVEASSSSRLLGGAAGRRRSALSVMRQDGERPLSLLGAFGDSTLR
mmetsp:Transcript_108617/g.292074  ORF Transcript_108617/g.292074 Transcript_108617/m.292074 type:complete len:108 (-) Transcript_108617:54-377(-)